MHTLPPLPYAYDALEPYIDEMTMRLHHTKHHQAYIDNLNKALEGYPDLQSQPVANLLADLASVPESIRTAVRFHGGGHLNHSLFWSIMAPGGGQPEGSLAAAIRETYGDVAAFQEAMNATGLKHLGSGWVWLTVDRTGALHIESTANHDHPITEGRTPVLVNDLWEHAYYLRYQNRRGEYLANWWHVVNWAAVAERYEQALAGI